MTILELLNKDFEKAKNIIIQKQTDKDYEFEDWEKQFNGEHAILSDPRRQGKYVGTGDSRRRVEPAKEIITFQKKIVRMAVAFMFGNPVELVLNNEEEKFEKPFELLKNMWKDLKLDYINKKIMRTVCIYTQAAELW